jgi:hypothetical protein
MADTERMTGVFPEPTAEQSMAARQHEIEMFRRAWDEGKASGSAGPLKMAEVIAEAKEQAAREG